MCISVDRTRSFTDLQSLAAYIDMYTGCLPLLNTDVTVTGISAPSLVDPIILSPAAIEASIFTDRPSAILTIVEGWRQLTPAWVAASMNDLLALSATYYPTEENLPASLSPLHFAHTPWLALHVVGLLMIISYSSSASRSILEVTMEPAGCL